MIYVVVMEGFMCMHVSPNGPWTFSLSDLACIYLFINLLLLLLLLLLLFVLCVSMHCSLASNFYHYHLLQVLDMHPIKVTEIYNKKIFFHYPFIGPHFHCITITPQN